MLRLGIAGCGWAGERHRAAAGVVEGVEVTAIADPDAETRRERRSEWGVDAYAGYEALVAEADLDAVVVALPRDLHEDATVRAARAGVDVLCEKPIARTVAEADRMLDAAADADAGVRLVVASPPATRPGPGPSRSASRRGPWDGRCSPATTASTGSAATATTARTGSTTPSAWAADSGS